MYSDDEMEYILQRKSKEMIELANAISKQEGDEIAEYAKAAFQQLLNGLEKKTVFYKDELFQEEDEYRLVYNHSVSCDGGVFTKAISEFESLEEKVTQFKLSDMKFRVGAEGIISFFELSFEPIMNDIIGEIVLGPKCKMSTADIEFLLSAWGYNCIGNQKYDQRGIYIHHSELTYR